MLASQRSTWECAGHLKQTGWCPSTPPLGWLRGSWSPPCQCHGHSPGEDLIWIFFSFNFSFLKSFQFQQHPPCPLWVRPIWSTLAPLPAAWWLSYWSTCWTCNICLPQTNQGEQRRRKTWATEHCGRLHQAWEWPHTWGGVHRGSQQTAGEIPYKKNVSYDKTIIRAFCWRAI